MILYENVNKKMLSENVSIILRSMYSAYIEESLGGRMLPSPKDVTEAVAMTAVTMFSELELGRPMTREEMHAALDRAIEVLGEFDRDRGKKQS